MVTCSIFGTFLNTIVSDTLAAETVDGIALACAVGTGRILVAGDGRRTRTSAAVAFRSASRRIGVSADQVVWWIA